MGHPRSDPRQTAPVSNATQNKAFARELKAARQGLGYTVQDLADELSAGDDPPSAATLNAWENAKESPREWERETVDAVEAALGTDGSLAEALGWPAA